MDAECRVRYEPKLNLTKRSCGKKDKCPRGCHLSLSGKKQSGRLQPAPLRVSALGLMLPLAATR